MTTGNTFREIRTWLVDQGFTEVGALAGGYAGAKWAKDDHIAVLGTTFQREGEEFVPVSLYRGGSPTHETNGATVTWLEEHLR